MSAAAIAWVAAPLLLLPLAYALWWLDRYRAFPLVRFLATAALAIAVGLLAAATWPEAVAAHGTLAGAASAGAGAMGESAARHAVEAAVLALGALAVLLLLLGRGRVDSPMDGFVLGVAAGVGLALPPAWLLAESVPGVAGAALAGEAVAPVAAAAAVGVALAYVVLRRSR